MGYTDKEIKQAELNLKGYAPIVKEYSGFIVLANSMHNYRGKCSRIGRGDRNGFYTIKRALEMGSDENSNCTIHGVMCRWYMVSMIIPLPILMNEDTMVEMLFTKIWLFTFGCSIVIYYFNRNNGT